MNAKFTAKNIAYIAVLTALVAICTAFIGVPIGTGYFNLGDTVIFTAAYLFGPFAAMIAGGLGAFIGDLIVFPTTMVFTLFIKAVEGLICGLLMKAAPKIYKGNNRVCHIALNALAMVISGLWMAAGYLATQALLWGTLTAAIIQLPWDILQGVLSGFTACLLLFGLKLRKLAAQDAGRNKGGMDKK